MHALERAGLTNRINPFSKHYKVLKPLQTLFVQEYAVEFSFRYRELELMTFVKYIRLDAPKSDAPHTVARIFAEQIQGLLK